MEFGVLDLPHKPIRNGDKIRPVEEPAARIALQ